LSYLLKIFKLNLNLAFSHVIIRNITGPIALHPEGLVIRLTVSFYLAKWPGNEENGEGTGG
jgi:hypothetical protein